MKETMIMKKEKGERKLREQRNYFIVEEMCVAGVWKDSLSL